MGESVIQQSELRNNNAEVMRRVDAGESFVVTVHGRPVADLVPHQRAPSGRAVPLGELRTALYGLGVATDSSWRADIEEARSFFDGDDSLSDPWERGTG